MKGNATLQAQRFQNEKPIVRHSSTDFVKVEMNLASIGFFTPSHKRISGAKKKTIVWNRQSEGQRVEVRAVILPSLPMACQSQATKTSTWPFKRSWPTCGARTER